MSDFHNIPQNSFKRETRKWIRRRNFQFYLFIALNISAVLLVILTGCGVLQPTMLWGIIPIILAMYISIQLWIFFNDIVILRRYIHDKEFRYKFNQKHMKHKK
jgi:hypothetical protein